MRSPKKRSSLNRREALKAWACALAAPRLTMEGEKDRSLQITVWDERQPEQKKAYGDFLGNTIAEHLRKNSGLNVRSVALDDPEQGLSDETIQGDVLIWWGHVRNREVKFEKAARVIDRVEKGLLSLIALHSAHWSTPFVEAMNRRSILDAIARVPEKDRGAAKVVVHEAKLYQAPKRTDPPTPSSIVKTGQDGAIEVDVRLPNCCFPAYRADGKPSRVRTLLKDHPLAEGIPKEFEIRATEMYDGPFHVPKPDATIFEEYWPGGERFPSGSLWTLGKGLVFYFRPGHETYPVYKQAEPLRIVENAAVWMGSASAKRKLVN